VERKMPKSKKHTKRAEKREKQLAQVIKREARLNEIVESILTAKKLIIECEKDLKLPRSDFEDKLGDIEEHFNELRDEEEGRGLALCGDDVEEWIEAQGAFKDNEADEQRRDFGGCSFESATAVDSKGRKTRIV
jgi:hypothetical protein